VRGSAGQGISLAYANGEKINIKASNKEQALSMFILTERSIVQEVVVQPDEISKINASCVNTIRVLTLYTRENTVIILGATMRFGVGDSIVDNWSAGGVAVGVDKVSGKLLKTGYDKFGKTYISHPISKVVFENFQIPQWNEILQLAITAQMKIPYYKLLGMDIALSNRGPILIELNAFPDLIFQEQTSGPLLKDEKIRSEFEKYGLFINKFQENIKYSSAKNQHLVVAINR
jgi:hypothetical protein